MKHLIAVMAMVALIVAQATGAPQPVKSEIKKVTVFPDRAQVSRVASANLDQGERQLVFEDLPLEADDASFHAVVHGDDGILFLGLTHKVVQHLESRQTRIAEVEKKIADIEKNQREPANHRQNIFWQERELLLALGKAGGEQMNGQMKGGAMDVKSWESAYNFFSREFAAISDSLRLVGQIKAEADTQLTLLKNELQEIRGSGSRNTKTIQVDLQLAKAGAVDVTLDYVVPNAVWVPIYDARLNADEQVDLSYSADVQQRTGEDWNDVNLTLSTARPAEGITPGDISPWVLVIFRPAMETMNFGSIQALRTKSCY